MGRFFESDRSQEAIVVHARRAADLSAGPTAVRPVLDRPGAPRRGVWLIIWVIAGLLGLATGLRIGWALVTTQSLVSPALIVAFFIA